MPIAQYDTILCDLGNFSLPLQSSHTLSTKHFRSIFSSSTWFEYETGRIAQVACYDRLGHGLSLDPADIRKAGGELHTSLRCNTNLASFLRELKDSNQGALRIFAFDGIFTSFEAGRRKSDPEFYRYTPSEASLDPSRTIFIDDKPENVLSACSQGLHGLVYRDFTEVKRALLNLLGDSVLRGQRCLESNGRNTPILCSGVAIQEKFSQLLILEMTNDR
ncbi:hypothetical protein ARMGADRAFT_1163628 [Armillaria gallica]|uniref:HAD-like protein n=1 Tax=Armillaria gallica TaxID=47427 RepID=A0A2H3E3P4_ARMGA|nr:hypothetical protein ARMGADRAFT_1163628 [Armillaria gallica]